ncbi:CDP-diacylglycerol--serine O-phosphatidyltransferase [bacterium]|nr:CDP-diacylglycerol--serine O-phosphatidyltransferase [bacterium]
MKHEGLKKGIYLLPNLFTTANLFCGYFAIVRSIHGDFLSAAWMIILAGFFDFMDGRVARMTNAQSEFGLEYDSLVDLTTFGVATSLLMYNWTLKDYGKLGWAAAFIHTACCALRLARFNTQAGSVEKKAFQGLPTPASAGFCVSYIIFSDSLFGGAARPGIAAPLMMFFLAVLMVSNVPYRSFKVLDKKKRVNFFLLFLIVAFIVVLASAPQVMFFIFGIFYVSMGLLEMLLRSPEKIRNFKDFMVKFFQADPDQLMMEDDETEITNRTALKAVNGEKDLKD